MTAKAHVEKGWYALNWETSLPNHPRSTTGGKETDIVLSEALCQV